MVLAVLAAACSGAGTDRSSAPADEAEVPRPAVELLVERFTRGGVHSWYTMAPDGGQVAPFAGVPGDALAVVPAPDGRTLALLRATAEGVHLWLMDRDGGTRRPLVEGVRVVHEVGWSPDGARLVFSASTLEETEDLWVIGADGTGARRLTFDPTPGVWFDRSPAWSPDGARIAFSSNRSGVTRLWLVNADGSGTVQVLPEALESSERRPAWSADGLLTFESATAEGPGIGLVRPDGTGYRRFAPGGDVGRPAWSPDGRVLYTNDVTGDLEVFALDPATGASENLTHHTAHDLQATPFRRPPLPAWRGLDAPRRLDGGAAATPALACGDVVADGAPDLILLEPTAARLTVLEGTGDGGFGPGRTLDASLDQREVAVADVSRDGIEDAVVLATAALWVWRGGAGGPGVPEVHELPGAGRAQAVADLDDDGSADVVVVHERSGSPFHVRVYRASPADGALAAVLDLAADRGEAGRACAGDVTGEGAADLVVLAGDGSALLFPGHGDITFGLPAVAASGLALDAGAIPLCADLDGDRRADLALLGPGAAAGLSVHRSTGAGFAAPVSLPAAGTSVAAADLDRDGDLDLVVVGPAQAALLFLRNLGDGRFARPERVAVGGAPLRVAAADLDRDDWPDLVVADADGSVAVLRNLGRPAP